jgi:hypothetical protein
VARRKTKTKAFLKSRDQRKRVEMRFAHLKTHHGFERLRLRALSGAGDEFPLPPSYKISRPWPVVASAPRPPQPSHKLRSVGFSSVGCVRAGARGARTQKGQVFQFLPRQTEDRDYSNLVQAFFDTSVKTRRGERLITAQIKSVENVAHVAESAVRMLEAAARKLETGTKLQNDLHNGQWSASSTSRTAKCLSCNWLGN